MRVERFVWIPKVIIAKSDILANGETTVNEIRAWRNQERTFSRYEELINGLNEKKQKWKNWK